MSQSERTCTRCGTVVAPETTRCPVCGAQPDVGPLVVRRESPPALPLRQIATPVAAGAAVVALGAGLRLAREILPRLRLHRSKPAPPAVVEEPEPRLGRVVAVQRRFWAMGDSSGTRQWGAEETVWHRPAED